ncbi:TrpB-like pyridoxal phosphate-dependent enzyme [Thermoflexus sp.]|uniref:TrpB-like pyridoxal phosphate-dependent enzyme n=1 Tax=Thermoflexus sp. TaxID=1969742 RepID=UPI002ADD5E15|nr:TrpB-like pyridoxal phosphate-dependent enzyme [Thermoflexus sp.]
MRDRTRFLLSEEDIPKAYYNILADLPFELPPVLHPATGQPIGPDDLAPLFPMALIQQEVSREREIEIPEPVREIYRLYRPTPLIRARRLEKTLDTPAHIYYKYEGVSPAGSHKLNTALAQAFYNQQEGVQGLTTETGAGQWGSALAMACRFFDLECTVFMVKVSYQQKPYRRILMETFGARVIPSPSPETAAGRKVLAENPDSPGSLGIAISEAVEAAATSGGRLKYSLGSVLNHVLLHQTVIGLEAKKQMELAGEYPDLVIGCVGGGSNFAGLALPFMRDRLVEGRPTRFIAVEPTAAPSLTKGVYAYDYGDTVRTTPLLKMYTLGHTFTPAPIHAGGLRYHGMAPILCALYEKGHLEAVAYPQTKVFEAAVLFARTEGIIPAPESAHAIRAVIDEALRAKEEGVPRVILFNLSGHGHFDLAAYDQYLRGELADYEYPAEEVARALASLPSVSAAA